MSPSFMLDVYIKEIRSVLEQAVPVWNGALTVNEVTTIERVQKTALYIILGNRYVSYEHALLLTDLNNLSERRKQLCINFAKKDIKKADSLFDKIENRGKNRSKKKSLKVREYRCNSTRFWKSSLPYLSRLINNSLR